MEPYYSDALTTIYHGECLAVMAELVPASFDAIICDPPYGTTACAWDSVIPFEPMWRELKRLIKPRGAIVLFGSQPFTSALVMSNPKQYRHAWVWEKTKPTGFALAKVKPLKDVEDIVIFSKYAVGYNPQGLKRIDRPMVNTGTKSRRNVKANGDGASAYLTPTNKAYVQEFTNWPRTILRFPNGDSNSLHPTQKPLALMEYLIRTYTNEGDTVLDFTMGSGTTLRAAKNLKRHSVGIELLEQYCNAAVRRLAPTFEEPIRDATPVAALGPLFDL